MKHFHLRCNLDKWLHQNKATIVDYAEGCLLDNMIADCKRGIAYIFESYVNPNMSEYNIFYLPNNEKHEYIEKWLQDRFDRLIESQEA